MHVEAGVANMPGDQSVGIFERRGETFAQFQPGTLAGDNCRRGTIAKLRAGEQRFDLVMVLVVQAG